MVETERFLQFEITGLINRPEGYKTIFSISNSKTMSLFTFFKPHHDKESRVLKDTDIDRLYPIHIRKLAHRHWTPVDVTQSAAKFLAQDYGAKILDIGSGAGKFCLAAAMYQPDCFYYGVEQRKHLIDCAERAKQDLNLHNVSFIHANIKDIDFNDYDHLYFFNAFYEHLDTTVRIDEHTELSIKLYHEYTDYLFDRLVQMRRGTRLVTYYGKSEQIPSFFSLQKSTFTGNLKFWVRN